MPFWHKSKMKEDHKTKRKGRFPPWGSSFSCDRTGFEKPSPPLSPPSPPPLPPSPPPLPLSPFFPTPPSLLPFSTPPHLLSSEQRVAHPSTLLMDINELPLVDASSIVDFAAVSARGILCAKDGLISERSPNGETISEVARSRKDRVQCMVLVPGKELRLWVGMSSGYVHVYAVDHNSQPSTERVNDSFGACRAEKLAHSGPVSCIISHGRRVYTGSGDKYIFEWHAATMELLRTLPTQRGAVRALAAIGLVLFSSDSTDHSIRCWNLNTCEPAGKLTGHKAVVRSIMYHLQNGTLWTGAEDGKIVIWDVGEQRMLTTLTHHTHSVTSLCQTSSGYSASAGLDSMMCIYTARTPTAPVCIRQINVPSIMTILPVCEEDENVLLWCVRKRLGSKLFELSGHSPATAEMDREAVPPRSTKKRPPAVKRSPSAVHTPASTRDSSVRGRSPAPVKRRGQSPSPGPASRRPSPGRLPMQRQDSVQSAQQQQKQARLQEELTVVSEENKVLRRQLLQTQAEMAKERRSFESQLQHLADKEGAVTNTLYRATNNVADMLGMVKRLAITRPEVKNEMKDLLKCILDTNRVIREMGGGGGGGSNSTRRTSSIPSPLKYGRFRSPSPRGRRGSASPHSMSHSPRSRDTNQYATRSDAASLTVCTFHS